MYVKLVQHSKSQIVLFPYWHSVGGNSKACILFVQLWTFSDFFWQPLTKWLVAKCESGILVKIGRLNEHSFMKTASLLPTFFFVPVE